LKGFKKIRSLDLLRNIDDSNYKLTRWHLKIPEECVNHFILYSFLKKNFGDPSYTMLDKVGGKFVNIHYKTFGVEKQQWGYVIRSENGAIEIYDKERSYIYCFGYTHSPLELPTNNNDFDPIDVNKDNNIPLNFRNDLKVFMSHLREFALKFKSHKKIHYGHIIVNPFYINYNNFRFHMKLLRKQLRKLRKIHYPDDYDIMFDSRLLATSAFILLIASFEGFIEMIYSIFLKSEIDTKLRKFLLNQRLETKIHMLSIVCDGFNRSSSKILKSQNYIKLRNLMEIRNKLLHGNIEKSRITSIVEDKGFLFYLNENEESFDQKGHYDFFAKPDFKYDILEFIEMSRFIVDQNIKEILSLINRKNRTRFSKIVKENYIGFVRTRDGIEFVNEQVW
jgi:hypothetical protein